MTTGYLTYQNLKQNFDWNPKFLAPSPTNSSVGRIFSAINVTSIDSLFAEFSAEGANLEQEQVIILINPQFFNDNFLGELAQSLYQLQQSTPGIKIVTVNEDELTQEQRGQFLALLKGKSLADAQPLDKLPAGLIKQNTLFFTKNSFDDAFEELRFSTFFNNKEYVTNYF
jgi:hypothetical protein